MSINLSQHIRQRAENREWLANCLGVENNPWLLATSSGDSSAFPYRPDPDATGSIRNGACLPTTPNTTLPSRLKSTDPRFIINIPQAHIPQADPYHQTYLKLVQGLQQQTYSSTSSASTRMMKRRLFVVVGTNQIHSLDKAVNRSFVAHIRSTPQIQGIPIRRMGFFWTPVWEKTSRGCRVACLYSARKAYQIVKALLPSQAKEILETYEHSEGKIHRDIVRQVPYQNLRERIMKSNLTRDALAHFVRIANNVAIYLTIMDADFKKLRTGKNGIFSCITSQIKRAPNPPSAVGVSYCVSDTELPLIKIGVKMDIAVRIAVSKIVPYGAYLPEPLLPVLVRKPYEADFLHDLTFVRGAGCSLESRRIIQSGKERGHLNNDMLFIEDSIETTVPSRWRTKTTTKVTSISATVLKRKSSLKALRGLSQSHAFSKNWADNLYIALDFQTSCVTDATGPMMWIFATYDPISRMYNEPGRYSTRVFDRVMSNYSVESANLSEGQKNTLENAKEKLRDINMNNDQINLVIEAAKASGRAIFQILQSAIS